MTYKKNQPKDVLVQRDWTFYSTRVDDTLHQKVEEYLQTHKETDRSKLLRVALAQYIANSKAKDSS
jgi:metal-responsive CopG/Arc/MetJ family transcriptional regulator